MYIYKVNSREASKEKLEKLLYFISNAFQI